MYQPQYEVQGQPGAVYEITALEDVITPDGTVHLKAGELAAALTTGSDGTATSEPLYLSRYQVKEITAPDGMVIDPEPKEVVLSYAGQEVEITSVSVGFVNERQKVEISLKKLLEQDETFSLGMNEEWKNITFGLFAAEQLTASDGTSIPADGLMETIGIDENGNAVFTTDIPCGASLYVQEIGTDDHYILSDKKYPVVFEYAGQDVAKVEIEANDGEAIENTLKRGKVSGWKVDQDGFELGGAVIGLFRFDETGLPKKPPSWSPRAMKSGTLSLTKVPAGNFLVREIAPPKAFVLTEEIFPVEITEDGQTIEITIENQIIKGTAETIKVDADYPDHKLSEAVFEVYADVDNNGEFNADIDKLAGEMTETEPGLYQMKDLVYGNYFLHEKEAPEFFEKDDGYYPFSITENEAIVRIETEAGVGFLNKAQTGSLRVVKTADDDKIEGRTFKISGTDFMGNAYEQEFKTDENGEINLTLRVGEYTVSEVAGEDSEKYILPDDQTVEIKAGETTTIKMHNKLVPEVPSVPQTGDNPWMPAILGTLAGLAVLSGGALLFLRYTGKSANLLIRPMRIKAQKNENLSKRILHRPFVPELIGTSLVFGFTAGADQWRNTSPEKRIRTASPRSRKLRGLPAGKEQPEPESLVDLPALQAEYPDIKGWISIPGTCVDYPVLQSSADDPEYYLRRTYKGEWRTAGSLFFQWDCSAESQNTVVYGHNMNDGTMFAVLQKMADEAFRKEHSKSCCRPAMDCGNTKLRLC